MKNHSTTACLNKTHNIFNAGSNYQADKSTLTSQAEWDTLYLWTPHLELEKGAAAFTQH